MKNYGNLKWKAVKFYKSKLKYRDKFLECREKDITIYLTESTFLERVWTFLKSALLIIKKKNMKLSI